MGSKALPVLTTSRPAETMTMSQYLGRGMTSRGQMSISATLSTVVSTVPYLRTPEDRAAVIQGLKSKQIGGLAIDVYEGEGSLFYDDHSSDVIEDDILMRLMTFPNVLVSGHQAFFTEEALDEIATCSLRNLSEWISRGTCHNSLTKDSPTESGLASPVRAV